MMSSTGATSLHDGEEHPATEGTDAEGVSVTRRVRVQHLLSALGLLVAIGATVTAVVRWQLQSGQGDLPSRITRLSNDIEKVSKQTTDHETQVSMLQHSVERLGSSFTTATVSVTEESFSRLITPAGLFLFIIDKVEPYANGQRVTFRIANGTSLRYEGFSMEVQWGKEFPTDSDDSDALSEWFASLKQKTFKLTDTLQPGSWIRVSVVLAPAKADELGYVSIEGLDTDRVGLPVR